MLLSLALLAMSLSVDAFFLGVACATEKTKVGLAARGVICLCSVAYAGVSILAGKWIAQFFSPETAGFLGAFLLGLIGLTMVLKSFRKEKALSQRALETPAVSPNQRIKRKNKTFALAVAPFVITVDITKNPKTADLDHSGDISFKEAFFIGSALSFDSLSVGMGSAMIGLNGWVLALFIGLFQFLFLSFGIFLARRLKSLFANEKKGMRITGICLIVIGLMRFM